MRAPTRDVAAVERNASLQGSQQSDDAFEQRAFPSSVSAHEAQGLLGGDAEGYIPHDFSRTITNAQVFDDEARQYLDFLGG